MRRNGKALWAVLLIIVCVAVASGCGSANNEAAAGADSEQGSAQKGAPADKPSGERAKLVVYGGVQPDAGPDEAIAEFERLNPDIEVEYVRYLNDDQGNLKLDTSLLAGEEIDLYFSYSDDLTIKRIEGGVAEDLGPWLEKYSFDMEENYGDTYATYNGKVYGLPTARSVTGLYLNKDMFDAANIPIPQQWTMDEYKEITRKLTGAVNGTKVFGGVWDWNNVARFVVHTPELGADSFYKEDNTSNFDHPSFKSSIELLGDLMLVDKSHMSVLEYQTSNLSLYGEFLNQKAAVVGADLYLVRFIRDLERFPHDFVTAMAPFPTLNPGQQNYTWQGTSSPILMNANSKNKEAAFKLLQFIGTEGQVYLSRGGKIPAWLKADQDKVLEIALGPDASKIFDVESIKRVSFDPGIRTYVNTQFTGLSEMTKIWKEEVEKVLGGQQDADTAVTNAKKRADQALASALR